ncbi:MAG: class I SAM-dependent RNA methyltransferase [Pseudomonadota bacterium]
MRIAIEKLIHGGNGMGESEGKKILVPCSAPGDILEVEIAADHGSWAEGAVASVVEPAPCRVLPPCPVFGECGGCQWQHISYPAQLEWKKRILIETLDRVGKISSPNVLEALPSPKEWHYRNRIQLHVDSRGKVGFYRARSKDVVEFKECAIADERLNAELNSRREDISRRDKGIALRVKDDGVSFAQINSGQNEQLKKMLVEWLREVPHKTVFELYAGAGNFTFAYAGIAERVVASDIDGRAIRAAKEAQEKLGARNIEFVCAPEARAARRLLGDCDAVLVDPPRKGCAEVLEAVAGLNPRSIFYISCDPATLARDALALSELGFSLVRSLPVDMFPQTFHIESLSLFAPRPTA